MMTKDECITRITVRINEDLDRRANQHARRLTISKNALINLALDEYIKQLERK